MYVCNVAHVYVCNVAHVYVCNVAHVYVCNVAHVYVCNVSMLLFQGYVVISTDPNITTLLDQIMSSTDMSAIQTRFLTPGSECAIRHQYIYIICLLFYFFLVT